MRVQLSNIFLLEILTNSGQDVASLESETLDQSCDVPSSWEHLRKSLHPLSVPLVECFSLEIVRSLAFPRISSSPSFTNKGMIIKKIIARASKYK